MSPGTQAGSESNVSEDLSISFEIVGRFYFDPQSGSNIATWENLTLPPLGDTRSPNAVDAFHAEDEALTRVMAGLL
ncbi:hypothetical protein PITC_039040 [Penicillium italicum]|uniref:Uncharacterized protein n=1 Tax=Penicillium italicum TaxID=40296 RepID=A0A0A2L3D7_PENIT|nr:hypothetical protein PITC_039040 [Penicillium italicum]